MGSFYSAMYEEEDIEPPPRLEWLKEEIGTINPLLTELEKNPDDVTKEKIGDVMVKIDDFDAPETVTLFEPQEDFEKEIKLLENFEASKAQRLDVIIETLKAKQKREKEQKEQTGGKTKSKKKSKRKNNIKSKRKSKTKTINKNYK